MPSTSSNYLTRIWSSITDRGRDVIGRGTPSLAAVESLCSDLLSEKGEASGTAIARDLVEAYRAMDDEQRLEFFQLLATKFSPDVDEVVEAAEAYRDSPNPETLIAIVEAVEPPRQELIRRLNMAPHGTATIVSMREHLLEFLPLHPELLAVDADLQHLLRSWFNRGFLELRRIDWSTPAAILEKLFKYEAVHEIQGWPDMRRRLEEDRRCFAFFHPRCPTSPSSSWRSRSTRAWPEPSGPCSTVTRHPATRATADTAVFYSISNCQAGLRAISFGNFLIKQVVADLLIEQPQLKTFVTLSPVPRFRSWLNALIRNSDPEIDPSLAERLPGIDEPDWHEQEELVEALKVPLMRLWLGSPPGAGRVAPIRGRVPSREWSEHRSHQLARRYVGHQDAAIRRHHGELHVSPLADRPEPRELREQGTGGRVRRGQRSSQEEEVARHGRDPPWAGGPTGAPPVHADGNPGAPTISSTCWLCRKLWSATNTSH